VVGPPRLSGVDLDLHDVGELTPGVAALCALADSPSHLRGVAHIRGHETNLIPALAPELGRRGTDATGPQAGPPPARVFPPRYRPPRPPRARPRDICPPAGRPAARASPT